MKKATVILHGDCDGVIAAGLYIRRFLRDFYPGQIVLRHSHPWRLGIDLRKTLPSSDVEMVVLVDLALNEEIADLLLSYAKKGISIIIVDHHQSSEKAIPRLKSVENIKALWSIVQSTPQVLAQTILKNLNNYEMLLVNIANVCEGGNVEDEMVRSVADKVKLVLAVESTNAELIYKTVDCIVKGEEFWNTQIYNDIFWKAKWLLNLLLKKIESKSESLCGWNIASFTLPESLIFAGLFGIASSEYMKKYKRSIVLIREEEDKIVVTIRSTKKKALDICQAIVKSVDEKARSTFGGHREAASLTIKKVYSLEEVEKIVENVIKNSECVDQ
jgi:single-stranded DNA-specific DHH superfamily exonuclease